MKGIVYRHYGSPDVLRLEEIEKAVPQDNEVLIEAREDLTIMHDLMKAGKVTPVIDKRYRLSEVPDAIRYLEEGHARGKIVITLEHNKKQ